MSIDDTRGDDAFVDRIAKPLRAPERADDTFEARAMSAVHAAAAERSSNASRAPRSWWLRPRTVQLTPLASLTLAAGFAALVLTSAAVLERVVRGDRSSMEATSRAASAQASDTVHIVRFVFVDADARRVSLVGTFNQWQKDATLLRESGTGGVWTLDLPLSPGRHEYAFIVDDGNTERWVADPFAVAVRDEFGTESSVISVKTGAS